MNMKEIVQVMENKQMISLYDFLGRAAGAELGKKVAEAAAAKKVGFQTKEVVTKTYTGTIMMYPVEFLEEYFKTKPAMKL